MHLARAVEGLLHVAALARVELFVRGMKVRFVRLSLHMRVSVQDIDRRSPQYRRLCIAIAAQIHQRRPAFMAQEPYLSSARAKQPVL